MRCIARPCPCLIVFPVIVALCGVGRLAGQPSSQPEKKPAAPAPKQPEKPAAPKDTPAQPDAKPAPKDEPKTIDKDPYVLGFKMKRIDGTLEDLAQYKGKVVIMVNVASKCGYTPQYTSLQELYDLHKDKGLVILAFPANNFGAQEPGTNQEIAASCSSNYNITFPMFEKISVKGDDQHPLYKKLTAQPAPIGGDPKWNFTKFVVDKKGNVVARFDAKGDNGDRAKLEPGLIKKINELLGIKDDTKKDAPKAPSAGS